MIRPKLSLRRPLAVAGAALVGLAAAVAVAAPASAHHSVVEVQANCDTATGEWVTTWTVNSVAPEGVNHYKFVEVEANSYVGDTATAITIPGIAVTDGDSYPHSVSEPVVGTVRLAGTVTKASLSVKSKWENGFQEDTAKGKSIEFSESCTKVVTPPPAKASPKATVTADCKGDVAVKLQNTAEATKVAKFTVIGTDGFKKTAEVEPGKDTTIVVPLKNAAKITVTEADQDKPLFDDKPAAPEDCVKPGEPSGSYLFTCDELIFQIENPKDGETVTITFTPNKGAAQTLTVAPGETKTAKFAATEGLTVTPKAEGLDDASPIAWEKPASCTKAPGAGAGGPTLPKTGAPAAAIAGGAAVLLAIGAGLFFLARRRRIRFTA